MVKKLIIALILSVLIGCVNHDAYYRAVEAEANRPAPPIIKIQHTDGTIIEVADMRARRVIPPPSNPWKDIGRDILHALMWGGSMYAQYEMNESNQETQRTVQSEMFRVLGATNQSPNGASFKNVNGDIIYGDGNQQAGRIGDEFGYDYQYAFTDNSDNSVLNPSTEMRPEVVYSDVAVPIRPEVVRPEVVVVQ